MMILGMGNRLCKNGLLDEYKEQNKCNKAECFPCKITPRRLLLNLQNIFTNKRENMRIINGGMDRTL